MKPTVRVVCSSCLQSLEIEPDENGQWPTLCPICQGTIDSQFSDVSTPVTRIDVASATGDVSSSKTTPWTQIWQLGSLGSFGRFQIREELGDGGFGKVFKAYDPRLDRDVALKILKQVDPGERVRERFFREARAAARLKHRNIAVVHDAGCEEGHCWVAFEYVVGRPLSCWLDQTETPNVLTAVRVVRGLAAALDHAHSRGVFHRDLKPANVIIDERDEPHLIDFGLSRFCNSDSELTREGTVVGTPRYMAPEQACGFSHNADGRSDLYSLGVIFYELLTKHRPVDGPSRVPPWGISATVAAKPVPAVTPPRCHNGEVPPALEQICLKAMAPDPTQRYQNAAAMVSDLDRWLGKRSGGPSQLSFPVTTMVLGIAGILLILVTTLVAVDFRQGGWGRSNVPTLLGQPVDGAPSNLSAPEASVHPTGPYYISPRSHKAYHLDPKCPAAVLGSAVSESWERVEELHLPLCGNRRCQDEYKRRMGIPVNPGGAVARGPASAS